MTPTCPDCGAEVSAAALVCPRCGYPIRTPGPGGAPGGGKGVARLLVGGAVGCFVFVFVGGIAAALVIPRLAGASQRAREKEGVMLLRQAYVAEMNWWAKQGSYAPRPEDIEGWVSPDSAGHYTVRAVTLAGDQLCLEAVPRQGAPATTPRLRMNHDGSVTRDAPCAGEVAAGTAKVQMASGGSDDPILQFVSDVAAGVKEYRTRHGRPPATVAGLNEAYPGAQEDEDYAVSFSESSDGAPCYDFAHRGDRGGKAFSLDGDGKVFVGGGCSGSVLPRSVLASDPLLRLMYDLASAVKAYQAQHGTPPGSQAQLAEAFPALARDTHLAVSVALNPARVPCYELVLRDQPAVRFYSLNPEMKIFRGGGCNGQVIEEP